jgi:N-acetylmuramoyl-L-alanine amidase
MLKKIIRYVCYTLIFAKFIVANVFAEESLLAIDAGHSKLHSGASSASGKPEFAFNAVLAQTVSDVIVSHGIAVVRIGYDGTINNIKERTQIANKSGATFFLSIHHDSVQPQFLKQVQLNGVMRQETNYASGFSLFVSRKNPALETSLNCAIAIGAALKHKGLHPSTHHAEKIRGENREWANQENGVYYYDDLIVLKTANMPAVLLEAGIIVNREEEAAIQTPAMLQAIASAVEMGLLACKALNPT